MTQFLPPNLLALFAARDPIPYLPPVERLCHEKRTTGYSGVGDYMKYFDNGPTPAREKYETKEERQERRRREKQEQVTYRLEQQIALWDPASNEKSTMDPFKTIFIGRVNFDTTEGKLKREFESYGPVKKIMLLKDKKTSKPRGYAFVEYEHERDMHSAYKHGDGKKIDGKRVLVDVERGRTVKGWLPRRLGGGLGSTRRGGPEVNVKISGREDPDRERFREEKRDDGRRERRDRDRSRDRTPDHSVRRERRKSHERERVARNPERDREKDRKRRHSRERVPAEEEEQQRPRKRSRSREKKRHRDRSRSKDKKRDKREKDRDRERKERRVKPEKNVKREGEEEITEVRIKEEPVDDYPTYDTYDYNNHSNFVKDEM